MIHYFNPGEKILSLSILISPNHMETWKHKPPRPLPTRPKSCVPGTAAKVPPRTDHLKALVLPLSFPSPLLSGFRAILKKTLRPPFVVSSLETKQIEFRSFDWLQRAGTRATSPSLPREPEVATSDGSRPTLLSLHRNETGRSWEDVCELSSPHPDLVTKYRVLKT